MSRLIYTVRCECRSCRHEQDVDVQLQDGFSDADVRDALGESDECNSCYETNWIPMLPPDVVEAEGRQP